LTEPLFPVFQIPYVYRELRGVGEGYNLQQKKMGHEYGVFVHFGHEYGVFVHPVAKNSLVLFEDDPPEDDPVELDPFENTPLLYKTYTSRTSRPTTRNSPIQMTESIFNFDYYHNSQNFSNKNFDCSTRYIKFLFQRYETLTQTIRFESSYCKEILDNKYLLLVRCPV
jgi:hypothetical protein